ncbi:hypothetical protein BGW80DRAFT_1248697 [Lactifluus volemus]|nr:hypothetical protein BGW80DRAFT_1248697 [Lactifluus volemus]
MPLCNHFSMVSVHILPVPQSVELSLCRHNTISNPSLVLELEAEVEAPQTAQYEILGPGGIFRSRAKNRHLPNATYTTLAGYVIIASLVFSFVLLFTAGAEANYRCMKLEREKEKGIEQMTPTGTIPVLRGKDPLIDAVLWLVLAVAALVAIAFKLWKEIGVAHYLSSVQCWAVLTKPLTWTDDGAAAASFPLLFIQKLSSTFSESNSEFTCSSPSLVLPPFNTTRTPCSPQCPTITSSSGVKDTAWSWSAGRCDATRCSDGTAPEPAQIGEVTMVWFISIVAALIRPLQNMASTPRYSAVNVVSHTDEETLEKRNFYSQFHTTQTHIWPK